MKNSQRPLKISRSVPPPAAGEKSFKKLIARLLEAHLIGSTLVEGSSLTEDEARRILQGESIHGHIIDEHLELTNGRDAASYIHRMFFEKRVITTEILDRCHFLLFQDIDEKRKQPGVNRGDSGEGAFTVILIDGKTVKHEYEHPRGVASDYRHYINFHLNRGLPGEFDYAVARLAELYFHFQMLHPYADGNGRIGRFLVSAKAGSERGLFFRFSQADGPRHLEIMMSLTHQYRTDKRQVDLEPLKEFLEEHLEVL